MRWMGYYNLKRSHNDCTMAQNISYWEVPKESSSTVHTGDLNTFKYHSFKKNLQLKESKPRAHIHQKWATKQSCKARPRENFKVEHISFSHVTTVACSYQGPSLSCVLGFLLQPGWVGLVSGLVHWIFLLKSSHLSGIKEPMVVEHHDLWGWCYTAMKSGKRKPRLNSTNSRS